MLQPDVALLTYEIAYKSDGGLADTCFRRWMIGPIPAMDRRDQGRSSVFDLEQRPVLRNFSFSLEYFGGFLSSVNEGRAFNLAETTDATFTKPRGYRPNGSGCTSDQSSAKPGQDQRV